MLLLLRAAGQTGFNLHARTAHGVGYVAGPARENRSCPGRRGNQGVYSATPRKPPTRSSPRSTAPGKPGGPFAFRGRAVRRGWPALVGGCRRRTAVPAQCRRCSPGACGKPGRDYGRTPVARGGSMLAGLAPVSGVRSASLAAGCWVQAAPSQSSAVPGPVVSTTFFGCCPSDCTCPLRPRLAPPFVGACGAGNSLRRSFVADFLRRFPAPCPAGRQASVGHSSASFASSQKTTGGEGKLAGHHRPPHPPNPLQKEQHHERNTHARNARPGNPDRRHQRPQGRRPDRRLHRQHQRTRRDGTGDRPPQGRRHRARADGPAPHPRRRRSGTGP